MKEIIVNNSVINIDDIKFMEVTPKTNTLLFDGVRIWFKLGGFVDIVHTDPEKYIEEYFTSYME